MPTRDMKLSVLSMQTLPPSSCAIPTCVTLLGKRVALKIAATIFAGTLENFQQTINVAHS
jgi:hypothetical protein